VFCLPSRERTEAFGIVLMEAMRYGKPLVVSELPRQRA
jgi:glycosyltransferase involved in cell wall biosynthesis